MEPLEGCRNDTLVFLSLSKCLITENTLMIICKSFLGYDKKNFWSNLFGSRGDVSTRYSRQLDIY